MLRALTLSLAFASILALSPAALADQGRTLGPHRFVPSTNIPEPFLASYIAVEFTSGWARALQVPKYDSAGNPLPEKENGAISVMGGGFDSQIRIIDRLALRLAYGMSGRIGATAATLLSRGVSAVWLGVLGASVKILETDRVYLTGVLDLRHSDIVTISPLDYATGKAETLYQETFAWRGLVGVRCAWSVRDWLGLNAVLQGGPGFSEALSEWAVSTGLKASFSIEPATGAPVGFNLAYRFERLPADLPEAVRRQIVSGGVFLSGRNDFAIGLDIAYSWLVDRNDGGHAELLQAQVFMRYDFF